MNDWKDLEIGNIPSDFFVNDRYEIEYYSSAVGGWIDNSHSDIKIRTTIIEQQLESLKSKYRYRLKPLESIRITAKIARDLLLMKTEYDRAIKPIREELEQMYGRKVEIVN